MVSIKAWGWILAVLALANMIRVAFMEATYSVFNWIASIIVLLIAIVLLSKSTKKKVIAKSKPSNKKKKK
jgi:uncharacterized membrane protein